MYMSHSYEQSKFLPKTKQTSYGRQLQRTTDLSGRSSGHSVRSSSATADLSDQTRDLSDQMRDLSNQTRDLSDQTRDLSDDTRDTTAVLKNFLKIFLNNIIKRCNVEFWAQICSIPKNVRR